eukprot:CAMPEP_0206537888 /NCGR_PEP_ID=MMETSP0325_2-20121206/7561_1 /ASSEMBLY_ACC=CAM_ASM_000347 /TAXON_ID=2866 /ORGANISM="Crypthecodinium cohnii, Strain Seligo" /LENGTH=577 /DNA_ID=CAMNT_0054035273 /DNA_START=192 /DNA_END=1925 /DNA_ORIENTATION=-
MATDDGSSFAAQLMAMLPASNLNIWHVVIVAALALYGCAALCLALRYSAGTPERLVVNRFICCWGDLFSGKACCLYKVIFSPAILVVQSVRIYFFSCIRVYCRRLFWTFFGCCHSFFVDYEFPPKAASIGKACLEEGLSESSKEVIWVRAMDFGRPDVRQRPTRPHIWGPSLPLFQGHLDVQDILADRANDCWLRSALAILAEREEAITSLFLTPEIDPRGRYIVRLFDPQEQLWRALVVDDLIPCVVDPSAPDGVLRNASGAPQAKFGHSQVKQLWPMVLEKAFAKFCGSFRAVEEGITEWALVCMTGGKAWRYEVGGHSNTWERSDLIIFEDPKDRRACGFKPTWDQYDSGELFELLRYYHRRGAALCCGGVKPAGKAQGLTHPHALAVLDICTVRRTLHSKQYFRFVQVRRPVGAGDWKGPWSDGSPEWEQYPYVRKQLGFQEQADSYWIQWEDLCTYWSYIGCVDFKRDVASLRPPLYAQSDAAGPFKAFLRGCGRFWCLCSGLRHLLVAHEGSLDQVVKPDFSRSCGIDDAGIYCRVCEMESIHVDRSPRRPYEPHEISLVVESQRALLSSK